MAFRLHDTHICVVTAGLSLRSPARGSGNVSEPSLMSQDGRSGESRVRRLASFYSEGRRCQVSSADVVAAIT